MKCCKGILSKLSGYFDKELDEENRQNLQAHFADCGPCQIVFKTFQKTIELFSTKPKLKLPPEVSNRLHAKVSELQQKSGDRE